MEDTLILDELQAVPERWTNKELLGRRAVSTTMLHNHVLTERREGGAEPSGNGMGLLQREMNAHLSLPRRD